MEWRRGRKRSRLQVMINVLQVIERGCFKPTKIMYKTNTSWEPLMRMLDTLVERDFIQCKTGHNHRQYEITEKGREVLHAYFNLLRTLNPSAPPLEAIH